VPVGEPKRPARGGGRGRRPADKRVPTKEGVVTTSELDSLTSNIEQEVRVDASVEATFDALLEQMGPANETPDGAPLPMKIEARPGGRWYRDLGNDNGHFWGHVQAIKRPTLLEITGPLFMSSAIVSNVQYRLRAADGGTRITFRHSSFGPVPEGYERGLAPGWTALLERVRSRAEASRRPD
jgi:uncharacterized protein YndB with AHSA1/START domain